MQDSFLKYFLLLQGSRHLKFVDFSTSYSITGTFLRFFFKKNITFWAFVLLFCTYALSCLCLIYFSQLWLFRNLSGGTNAHTLEVLILRDCLHLKEVSSSERHITHSQ